MTGNYTFVPNTDGDDEGTSTFRWLRADTVEGTYEAIPGAEGTTYELQAADEGKFIKFEVTPVDDQGNTGEPAVSSATAAIQLESFELEEGLFTYSISDGEATVIAYSGDSDSDVIIPNNTVDGDYPVTAIGSETFKNLSNLTSLTLGENVETIGAEAFMNGGIRTVRITDNVTEIGARAFAGNPLDQEIILGSSVETIGEAAFKGTETHSFSRYLTLPESVSHIGDEAFQKAGGDIQTLLEIIIIKGQNVTIGDSVLHADDNSFRKAYEKDGPGRYKLDSGEWHYFVEEFVYERINDTNKARIIEYTWGGSNHLEIPDTVVIDGDTLNVTEIESGVFTFIAGGLEVETVKLPVHLEVILDGDWTSGAFEDQHLTTVEIPDNVERIGDYAFSGNNDLTNLILPEGLLEIGERAFDSHSLTNITIPASVTDIGNSALRGSLEYIVMEGSDTTIGDSLLSYNNNDFRDVYTDPEIGKAGTYLLVDGSWEKQVEAPAAPDTATLNTLTGETENLDETHEFSVDGGTTWTSWTSSPISADVFAEVTAENNFKVRVAADGAIPAGDVHTIQIDEATGVTPEQGVTYNGQNIHGLNASQFYIYNANDSGWEWIQAAGDNNTDLGEVKLEEAESIQVRLLGNGRAAAEAYTITRPFEVTAGVEVEDKTTGPGSFATVTVNHDNVLPNEVKDGWTRVLVGMSQLGSFEGPSINVTLFGFEHNPENPLRSKAKEEGLETQFDFDLIDGPGTWYILVGLLNEDNRVIGYATYEVEVTSPGELTISAFPLFAKEDVGEVTFNVIRSNGSRGEVSVDYATEDGENTSAGTDYTETTGTLTWADGEDGFKFFTVPIINREGAGVDNRNFKVRLSNPTGDVTLVNDEVTFLIQN